MSGNPLPESSRNSGEIHEIRQLLLELHDDLQNMASREGVPQRFLTISSAARFTDLSEESIRRLIASQKLTAHRPVRGRVLIDRLELESLIRRSVQNPRRGRGRSKSH